MTAAPFTPEQAAKLAAFDAAPVLAESSPMTRATLALAEELDGHALNHARRAFDLQLDETERVAHLTHLIAGKYQEDAAARIRATVADVLAADPEPREAVVERMARAMWEAQHDPNCPVPGCSWETAGDVATSAPYFRRLASAALNASREGMA